MPEPSSSSRAALRSPFRSPATALDAFRGRARRLRLGRLAAVAIVAVALGVVLQGRFDEAARARDRWGPTTTVWVARTSIDAGEPLTTTNVEARTAPTDLVPAGAAVEPFGLRTRASLEAGEIITTPRLSAAASPNAARTPDDTLTVALERSSDLLRPGDRVDLHDQLDGRRLAVAGAVVDVTEGDVAVAIAASEVSAVVRALGRGGVVPVLRGD